MHANWTNTESRKMVRTLASGPFVQGLFLWSWPFAKPWTMAPTLGICLSCELFSGTLWVPGCRGLGLGMCPCHQVHWLGMAAPSQTIPPHPHPRDSLACSQGRGGEAGGRCGTSWGTVCARQTGLGRRGSLKTQGGVEGRHAGHGPWWLLEAGQSAGVRR